MARGIGAHPAPRPMATPAGPWNPTTDWRLTGIEIPQRLERDRQRGGSPCTRRGTGIGPGRRWSHGSCRASGGLRVAEGELGAGRPSVGRSTATFRVVGDPRQASRGQPRENHGRNRKLAHVARSVLGFLLSEPARPAFPYKAVSGQELRREVRVPEPVTAFP